MNWFIGIGSANKRINQSHNHIAHSSQSLCSRFEMENMGHFHHFNKSEASVPASVILIHTRSEDSSDSDSYSASASTASVASEKQPLFQQCPSGAFSMSSVLRIGH